MTAPRPAARPQLEQFEARETPAANQFVGVGGTADGVSTTLLWDTGSSTLRRGTTFQWFGANSTFPVREAVGPLNSATSLDVAIVAGPGGGSKIGLVNGAGGIPLVPVFSAFEESYNGGLNMTLGNLDNTGGQELVVAADQGGAARVAVYTATGGQLAKRADFFAFSDDLNFRGGARVAVGDVNGDGTGDLIVSAGFGGGPRVAIFDGKTLFANGSNPPRLVGDFFAFPGDDATRLRNGVFVTAGDFTADGKADLAFGGGPGGAPRVFVLNGAQVAAGNAAAAQAAPIANFFVNNDTARRDGVRLVSGDIANDGRIDLVVATGPGQPAGLRTYRSTTLAQPNGNEPPSVETINPYTVAPAPTAAITSTSNGQFVGIGTLAALADGVFVG